MWRKGQEMGLLREELLINSVVLSSSHIFFFSRKIRKGVKIK